VIEELLAAPARQAAAAARAEHRPWPVPEEPWVIAQTWDDLLFAHWRVPAEALARLVPQGLEIDQFDGSAWLGVTPFVLNGFRFRGSPPLPWLSSFPELNVRTYVSAGGKPGIWFFSLDAASRLAVEGARHGYKLPYFHARISVERWRGGLSYTCRRLAGDHVFEARYRPAGEVLNPTTGSLESFLTERYCLYTLDSGQLARGEIQHPPWPLQPAEVELETNTMPPLEIPLEGAPLCHFSRRQDVVVWPLRPA
jgi:uncharacterized protein